MSDYILFWVEDLSLLVYCYTLYHKAEGRNQKTQTYYFFFTPKSIRSLKKHSNPKNLLLLLFCGFIYFSKTYLMKMFSL